MHMSSYSSSETRRLLQRRPSVSGAAVRHIEGELRLDSDAQLREGTVAFSLLSLRTGVAELEFLATGLTVRDVALRFPSGRNFQWRQVGPKIHVMWRRPLEVREAVTLEMAYSGDAGPSAESTSSPESLRWPLLMSSPCGAVFDLEITVPEPLQAVTAGELIGARSNGRGRRSYRWRSGAPVSLRQLSVTLTPNGPEATSAGGSTLRTYLPGRWSREPLVRQLRGALRAALDVLPGLLGQAYPLESLTWVLDAAPAVQGPAPPPDEAGRLRDALGWTPGVIVSPIPPRSVGVDVWGGEAIRQLVQHWCCEPGALPTAKHVIAQFDATTALSGWLWRELCLVDAGADIAVVPAGLRGIIDAIRSDSLGTDALRALEGSGQFAPE